MGYWEEVENIAEALERASAANNFKYMLITQGISPTTELVFKYSMHFTDEELRDFRIVFGRSFTSIRPVLNRTYTLKLIRSSGSWDAVRRQLHDLFNSLNQGVCKEIAKLWIRILAPNKQKHFPYSKKNIVPNWWPQDVVHTEPDHLKKEDRIKVLISVVTNKNFKFREVDTKAIKTKVDHTEAIVHEIIYIAYFSGLFYSRHERDDKSYEVLSSNDKKLLDQDEIELVVSDFRYDGSEGISQSKIKDEYLNRKIFKLKGATDVPTKQHTESSKKVRKRRKPSKKPSSKALAKAIIESLEPQENFDLRITPKTLPYPSSPLPESSTRDPDELKFSFAGTAPDSELMMHAQSDEMPMDQTFDPNAEYQLGPSTASEYIQDFFNMQNNDYDDPAATYNPEASETSEYYPQCPNKSWEDKLDSIFEENSG
ncbi:conserved hypothetical protein [Candida dubliniensis CD36]|uniref:Subtelomeric hrmA-associated cluster protein AFUB-079030/YDR124W-like helical bundle domain-containing protein n=1 Tax=Candida dubliniensis (strain CD36 / ATCC MYA-646 / CBS 7987 / NCPF 3949 / NRRL Y-17841) TaxID=573826 RepID=B9WMZ7_CANDC|nr:conserved hypothetical protein [Candida dubliniensis CD36]CAX40464.1 conserved hypothetical protein [Candida dubliniensis CD36]